MKAVWNGVTIAGSDETIVVAGTKATVRPKGTPGADRRYLERSSSKQRV